MAEVVGTKLGVEHIKSMVVLMATGYEAFVKAKADGAINAADVGYLVPVFMAIGPALSDVKQIIPEAKDLDADELQDVIAAVKAASPTLATEAEVLIKVQACLNVARSIKDAWLAFTTPSVIAIQAV